MQAPGYRSTVAALALGQLFCWAAFFYAFSSFVLPMQHAFGWSKPEVMGAYTLGLAVWGAAAYGVGAAIDRGHARLVLSGGAALGGAGLLIWSQTQGLALFYIAWVLIGTAMAMTLYEPAFNVLTKRYPERYREGITSLTLVGGFASTLAFPAAAWLSAGLEWRGALAMIGAVMLLGVAPLHAWALRGAVMAEGLSRGPGVLDDATLGEALHERAFWLLIATFTLYAFVAAALWAHMMPALAAKGLGETQALAVVVWFGPAQVVGRVAYLGFGRWLSARALGLWVLAGLPLALAIFAMAHETLALFVFALLFGLVNGLVTIVRGNVVPDYFGRRHVGRISGAMNAIALSARAAAPLVTAWLLLWLPGYSELLMLLTAVGVAAVVVFALARRPST